MARARGDKNRTKRERLRSVMDEVLTDSPWWDVVGNNMGGNRKQRTRRKMELLDIDRMMRRRKQREKPRKRESVPMPERNRRNTRGRRRIA